MSCLVQICADAQADLSLRFLQIIQMLFPTVLSAKSDSDVMFCLQSYNGLIIDHYTSDLSISVSSSGVYKLNFT